MAGRQSGLCNATCGSCQFPAANVMYRASFLLQQWLALFLLFRQWLTSQNELTHDFLSHCAHPHTSCPTVKKYRLKKSRHIFLGDGCGQTTITKAAAFLEWHYNAGTRPFLSKMKARFLNHKNKKYTLYKVDTGTSIHLTAGFILC